MRESLKESDFALRSQWRFHRLAARFIVDYSLSIPVSEGRLLYDEVLPPFRLLRALAASLELDKAGKEAFKHALGDDIRGAGQLTPPPVWAVAG